LETKLDLDLDPNPNSNPELNYITDRDPDLNLQIIFLSGRIQIHSTASSANYNCPFYFPQAFEVLTRLILNPIELAASIMNVDSKCLRRLLNLTFHIHDFDMPYCSRHEALGSELGTFMLGLVNGDSPATSWTPAGNRLGFFMMSMVCVGGFASIRIRNEK
jgi:hypothetical protein